MKFFKVSEQKLMVLIIISYKLLKKIDLYDKRSQKIYIFSDVF